MAFLDLDELKVALGYAVGEGDITAPSDAVKKAMAIKPVAAKPKKEAPKKEAKKVRLVMSSPIMMRLSTIRCRRG
jgi:hypothetical protein